MENVEITKILTSAFVEIRCKYIYIMAINLRLKKSLLKCALNQDCTVYQVFFKINLIFPIK